MYRCIPAHDYANTLIDLIESASKRVVIKTMTFSVGSRLLEICHSMSLASARGIDVEVHLDRYAVLGMDIKSWVTMRTLRNSGVKIVWHGSIRLNPFSGRDHIKFALADDALLAFGGINMKESALDASDYMLLMQDNVVADWLYESLNSLTSRVLRRKDSVYYYDSGKPGQSTIYSQVLDLARTANRVLYVSKMAPNGALAEVLEHAKSRYYYNQFRSSRLSLMSKLAVWLDERNASVRSLYRGTNYIHAKCLVFDTPKRKTLITGSHNFNERGVIYGTRECALQTNDKKLIAEIENYLITSLI